MKLARSQSHWPRWQSLLSAFGCLRREVALPSRLVAVEINSADFTVQLDMNRDALDRFATVRSDQCVGAG